MGTQAFKQKPCTKPERDKGKTDHPAYMIRPLGIIPWTDAFAHKKGSCNVFPCVNKYLSLIHIFKYIFLKVISSLSTISSICSLLPSTLTGILDNWLRRRRLPRGMFWVATRESLSKSEIWALPNPTSTIAVPFWMIWSMCIRDSLRPTQW